MPLHKITESIYYIPGAVNIGCIVNSTEAILVDSGLADTTAKKVMKLVSGEGISIRAIINTHSHPDHCGGNAYIQQKTGADIYASELETGIIEYPYLHPLYFSAGAQPDAELTTKFFMSAPSKVNNIISSEEKTIQIGNSVLDIIPLPGHSHKQIGVAINGILFCGDAFISEEVLAKHKIPFNANINQQRKTLKFLRNSSFDFYVPAHCEPASNVSDVIDKNLEILDAIDNCILDALGSKRTLEQIVQVVCEKFDVSVSGIGQYCLINTTLTAHINSLAERCLITKEIERNLIYWFKK